jgi:hypothetical protein
MKKENLFFPYILKKYTGAHMYFPQVKEHASEHTCCKFSLYSLTQKREDWRDDFLMKKKLKFSQLRG